MKTLPVDRDFDMVCSYFFRVSEAEWHKPKSIERGSLAFAWFALASFP